MPVCEKCNKEMRTQNLEEYKKYNSNVWVECKNW